MLKLCFNYIMSLFFHLSSLYVSLLVIILYLSVSKDSPAVILHEYSVCVCECVCAHYELQLYCIKSVYK